MIAVGVGAGDCSEGAAVERLDDRFDMLFHVGAGIDHHDLSFASKVGLRAKIGEGRRVTCQQPGNPRLKRLEYGVRRVHCRASATNQASGLAVQAALARAGWGITSTMPACRRALASAAQ